MEAHDAGAAGGARMAGLIAAWLVHLYTASGFVLAFLAVRSVIEHDYRTALFYLWLQILVDATDGALARVARVSERIPWFSGAKLDDLVDYLTYVFVPAIIVWRGQFVSEAWSLVVPAAMLVSSGYGFSRTDAKTSDHFFTGFPSYWNVVVLYLLVLGLPGSANAAILLVLAVLVFVPIRYLYPSRTPVWRRASNALGAIWGCLMLAILWQYPSVWRPLVFGSLVYPGCYFALSLFLHVRPKVPR